MENGVFMSCRTMLVPLIRLVDDFDGERDVYTCGVAVYSCFCDVDGDEKGCYDDIGVGHSDVDV